MSNDNNKVVITTPIPLSDVTDFERLLLNFFGFSWGIRKQPVDVSNNEKLMVEFLDRYFFVAEDGLNNEINESNSIGRNHIASALHDPRNAIYFNQSGAFDHESIDHRKILQAVVKRSDSLSEIEIECEGGELDYHKTKLGEFHALGEIITELNVFAYGDRQVLQKDQPKLTQETLTFKCLGESNESLLTAVTLAIDADRLANNSARDLLTASIKGWLETEDGWTAMNNADGNLDISKIMGDQCPNSLLDILKTKGIDSVETVTTNLSDVIVFDLYAEIPSPR